MSDVENIGASLKKAADAIFMHGALKMKHKIARMLLERGEAQLAELTIATEIPDLPHYIEPVTEEDIEQVRQANSQFGAGA